MDTSIHFSVPANCGCNVTKLLQPLLPHVPHSDVLCPQAVSHNKPFSLPQVALVRYFGHSREESSRYRKLLSEVGVIAVIKPCHIIWTL